MSSLTMLETLSTLPALVSRMSLPSTWTSMSVYPRTILSRTTHSCFANSSPIVRIYEPYLAYNGVDELQLIFFLPKSTFLTETQKI